MMTCVYSVSARDSSSISSSCAAPRMPPSGFLISCARLRISSVGRLGLVEGALLAILAVLLLDLDQLEDDVREPSIWLHRDVHRQRLAGPADGRFSSASSRLVAKRVVADRDDESRAAPAASTNQSNTRPRDIAAARQAEHVLERRVGELAFAFGRDDGHHRRQQVERGAARPRRRRCR